MKFRSLVPSLLRSIVLLLTASTLAHAQTVPFGKNKIQYRDFDWRIMPGQHIDVYYYPEEEDVARLALTYGEESYAYLERKFEHHPFRRIPLIVYSSDQAFEQSNVYPEFIPEGVLGFTEYLKRRVALPFRGDYNQFRNTLRHELVHAFQISKLSEISSQHPRVHRSSPQAVQWWTEGLAEYFSSEQTAEDEMFDRDLVVRGHLPSIKDFTYSYSFMAYPLGAELHKYLSQRFGEEYIARMYNAYWKYDSFLDALAGVTGEDIEQLNREWRYALEKRFFPGYATSPPLDIAAARIAFKSGANFKPVLYTPPGATTPDLYFMSPRTGYTNIYRTSLNRGERGVETVVKGERTAEFESFHAYESRFDISNDGVIVFVSKYLDRDALVLWDIKSAEVVGRYQWPDLVGLHSPAWDPAGKRVVFEGLSNSGYSDLYTIDFTTQQRTALTNDRYREENPDWSPDGRTIVFASDRDRYGSDGYTNLYLIDVASQEIRAVTSGAWDDQDPRWSPDGSRIAFTSDRGGTYDLYEIDKLGNGRRLTSLTGGAFDPSWLPDGSGLVFSGFEDGGFRVFRYNFRPDSTGVQRIALADDAHLQSADSTWTWAELVAPPVATAASEPYKALKKTTVDFAGGDAVVAPGVGTAQGAQFLLSDMLGNHIVFLGVSAVQARGLQDFVDNFSGNLLYLNIEHRLNYGGGIYRFKGRFRDVAYNVYDEQTYGGYFLASYPFSKFHRIQLSISLENSNRLDVEDFYSDFNPDTRTDPRNLTRKRILVSNYVQYVKDNTLWLPTGPIDGERFNLTAGMVSCFACSVPSPVTNQMIEHGAVGENYALMADYRRYFRTSLYSAYAVRVFGYFSDGAIPARAVLGGPLHLRGYPLYSLTGSRVWLVNQEWRFPLLHGLLLGFPFGNLTLPGVQGALFADAGSSWLESMNGPEGTWGSYGTAFRMPVLGAFVLRLDVGRRFASGKRPPVIFSNGESFHKTFVDFFFGFNY